MKPKYLWLVAAAALSLGACSTDNTTDPELTPPHKNGYKISFTVAEDSETRTTLDEGDVLRWVSTDQVGIYTFGHSVNANNLTVAEVDQSPVVFSGDLQESVSSGDMFYAYYPYNARQSGNHREVKLSIPAEQTQTAAGVYNGESNPLVAVPMAIDREQSGNPVRIGSVRFRQLGAIVELQLSSSGEAIRTEKIRSVTFESETALAGDFKFNLTTVTVDGELSIEGYKLTKVKTTLDAPAAIPATGDGAARVYLTIAPGTYSGQIVVETDAAQYTFTLADAMTFKRAVIKGLPADLAEAQRKALSDLPISFADDNVRDICLTNWDENEDGELSYQEAAAVTDLGRAFNYNNSIFSFNELQYFTGLKLIRSDAFSGCGKLTSIKIPDGVTAIGYWAFDDCISLTNITLPDGVTRIEESAFEGCSSLESITLPNKLTTILGLAFSDCASLTSIHIPETVSFIGARAFFKCSSLSSFSGKYATADHRCLIQDGALLAFAPAGLTEYTIPDGVTRIGDETFRGCSSLASIKIPAGVTVIEGYVFEGCGNLTSVYCKPTDPPTLGFDVFSRTSSSMKIYVPAASVDTYKTANGWSGYADRIISEDQAIEFADQNVKQICVARWSTDEDSSNLSYKEAAAVTELAEGAFRENKAITSFNELQYFTGLKSIGNFAFLDCVNLKSIKIPESVTAIGSEAFMACRSLKSITLPAGVTVIEDKTFFGCSSLTEINIPEGVTDIGDYAFYGCSNLASINLPNTLTTIYSGAFRNCSSLESIIIPKGVTWIAMYTFQGCSNLTGVYCKPTNPPTLGNEVFIETSPSMQIYVPEASVGAYQAAEGWSEYAAQISADIN